MLSSSDSFTSQWVAHLQGAYPRFGTFDVILAYFWWFFANISGNTHRKSIPRTDLDSLDTFT